MPYNDFGVYEYEHIPGQVSGDPYRYSAEQFAHRVEEYLYDTRSPNFRDDHFLAWSIQVYELSKQGSGRPYDVSDYEKGNRYVPGMTMPPKEVRVDGGYAFAVEYPRDIYNYDDVPTSVDGTAADVKHEKFVQYVAAPHPKPGDKE